MKLSAIRVLKSKSVKLDSLKDRFSLHRISSAAWAIIRAVIVSGICFMIFYPTLLRLSVTFMQERDLFDLTIRYIPRNFTFDNILLVWRAMGMPETLLNTFRLSMLTSLLQLASCTIIGYGFARFNFKGRGLLFALVLVTLVVPPQTIMIPLFLHFRFFDILGLLTLGGGQGVNLLDSYWPFILMSLTGMGLRNGLYIFIMRQFFRGMPKELEEAAYVDGAGLFRTFHTIMLPSAVPAMVTIFLFSFVWQWTDNFYAPLFLRELSVFANTLSGLSTTIAQLHYWEVGTFAIMSPAVGSMYNNVGSLMVIIPLIVVYLVAQRHFIQSVERAGIVG